MHSHSGTRPLPPAELPRGLVFGASVWIAASWLVSIGVRPPLQPTSTAYTPAARMMIVALTIGIVIAWPLARFSLTSPKRPIAAAMLDTVSLLALTQIVLWPLRLVTSWTVPRLSILAIDLISVSVLVGGLIALLGWNRSGRTLAMIGLLAWLIGPPLIGLGLSEPQSFAALSPLVRAWSLGGGGPAAIPPETWVQTAVVGGVGLILWSLAIRSAPPRGLATPAASR